MAHHSNPLIYSHPTHSGEGSGVHSKKELIQTARLIAKESEAVLKLARKVADKCTDKRMKRVRTVFALVLIN